MAVKMDFLTVAELAEKMAEKMVALKEITWE